MCRASVLECGSPLTLLERSGDTESARGLAQSKSWRQPTHTDNLCVHEQFQDGPFSSFDSPISLR